MIGLTAKQRELYSFIANYVRERGIAPSLAEMGAALGTTKSRAFYLVEGLEERGYVRRIPHKPRAIELLDEPGSVNLRPELREAAVEYARLTDTTLSVVISEAVAAYLGKAA